MKGRFVWYELSTTDLTAASSFYAKVVGWNPVNTPMGDMDYWMFMAGEAEIAGAMIQRPGAKEMGAPPMWVGYIAVDDVDSSAAQITALGGKIYLPPKDIPTVGRFAVAADPQGAVFALFRSSNAPDQAQSQEGEGRVGWHELHAGEVNAAFDFYAKLFGWEKKDAMDMGEMGVYQMFGTADVTLGGMMTNPPESPAPPHWNYYFNVPSIDKAIEATGAAGGMVVMGPQEVPGGDFIAIGIDPQGAAFAVLGHR